jgi:hypothetical protein
VFSVRRDSTMIAALACWSKIGANGGNRVQPGRPDACRRRTGFYLNMAVALS